MIKGTVLMVTQHAGNGDRKPERKTEEGLGAETDQHR